MGYRREAIDCVKYHVLPLHKQIYAKYDGDFDRIYSDGDVVLPGQDFYGGILLKFRIDPLGGRSSEIQGIRIQIFRSC